MRRTSIIALITLLCVQSQKVFSQTTVGGTLTENTVWDVSGSPYILNSTLGVPSGITLTINPDVEVQGNFDVLVKGIISANGALGDSITFNGPRLIFKSTNLTSSTVEYLRFINSSGVQLADETEFSQDNPKNSGTLTVKNSNFNSNSYAHTKGYDSNAKLQLTNCSFTSSTIKGFYPRSEIIELVSCTINNTLINSDSYNYGIHLTDSQIDNSSFTIGCCGSNFNIENCEITSSTFSDYNNWHTTSISNSFISNTTFDLSSGHLQISDSELIAPENGTTHIRVETIDINSSVLDGQNTDQAIIISGNNGVNGRNSSIIDCTLDSYSNAIEVNRFNNFNFSSNNFLNISNLIIVNKWSSDINASGNYWGTTDESIIADKITDGVDDLNYGFVDFSGYLSAPTYEGNPPSDFTLEYPVNGSTIPYEDINFEWEESINDTPIEYALFINNQGTFKVITEITTESHLFGVDEVLFPNKSYDWYVMAIDDTDTTVSETSTFTLSNVPPSSFTLSSPSSKEMISSPTYEFNWEEATDFESVTYALSIFSEDYSVSFKNLETNYLEVKASSYLIPNNEYSWCVVASDNKDFTYSDTLAFSTDNGITDNIYYDTVIVEQYDTIYIADVTGIEYRSDVSDLTIYPNPTYDGNIQVEIESFSIEKIMIYDLSGLKVDEFEFEDSTIQLNYPAGTYFVFLDLVSPNDSRSYVVKKVVIK